MQSDHLTARFVSIFYRTIVSVSAGLDSHIGLGKSGYQVKFFSYFSMKTYVVYSLEVPHRGTSNEYPQHMFSSRNKKNIDTFWLKKAPYQELCLQL